MQLYNRIPIWENNRRVVLLIRFHGLLVAYFSNSRYNSMLNTRIDDGEAKKARIGINNILDECYTIVASSGVVSIVTVTPPPAIGGYVKHVEVLTNYTMLDQYNIGGQTPIDFVQRAIGVYESDKFRATVRTFNPLFWCLQALRWLISIPFQIIGQAGFDREKVEGSLLGRLFKVTAGFVTLVLGLLGILNYLGLLEWFKTLIGLSGT
jgi:hypothetical protein